MSSNFSDVERQAQRIADDLLRLWDLSERPRVGIILGSGWNAILGYLPPAAVIARMPYTDLAGFGITGVQGHTGEVVLARMGSELCVFFSGRFHLNEAPVDDAVAAVRRMVEVLRRLCDRPDRILVFTNAVGTYNASFRIGDVVIVKEFLDFYIQMVVTHSSEPQSFYHSHAALHPHLVETALEVGQRVELTTHTGFFLWTLGPHFGGPMQAKLMRSWGLDAVGMSGFPETTVTSLRGEPVLLVGCVSDRAWEWTTGDGNIKRVEAQAPKLLAFLEMNIQAWHEQDFVLPPDSRQKESSESDPDWD